MSGLLILSGVLLLYGGGELLVRGASGLARSWGMSPLVIGVTVVALGTSSPELAAILASAFKGEAEVAVGAAVGSNISNLGLILGLSAMIAPLAARARFLQREVPVMIGSALLLVLLAWNGVLGRGEAALLLALFGLYLVVLLRTAEVPEVIEQFSGPYGPARMPVRRGLGAVVLGMALLAGGAHALVEGAVELARGLGIPERVIGITVVALGTSLPELASCIVAARRGEGDILLGNLVGSNIFNVLGMLSAAMLVQPLVFPATGMRPDLGFMGALSLLALPMLRGGLRLSRGEGVVLLALYVGYVAWLLLR